MKKIKHLQSETLLENHSDLGAVCMRNRMGRFSWKKSGGNQNKKLRPLTKFAR